MIHKFTNCSRNDACNMTGSMFISPTVSNDLEMHEADAQSVNFTRTPRFVNPQPSESTVSVYFYYFSVLLCGMSYIFILLLLLLPINVDMTIMANHFSNMISLDFSLITVTFFYITSRCYLESYENGKEGQKKKGKILIVNILF